jgi:hypothetical protein
MVELKENGYLALNCNHSFGGTITKYYFWPLCYPFFFDIPVSITSLVSSNSSNKNDIRIIHTRRVAHWEQNTLTLLEHTVLTLLVITLRFAQAFNFAL